MNEQEFLDSVKELINAYARSEGFEVASIITVSKKNDADIKSQTISINMNLKDSLLRLSEGIKIAIDNVSGHGNK